MSCELLTGATGFLGSHLLQDALASGCDVAVLVRRGRSGSAQSRVEGLLEQFGAAGATPLAQPSIIEGDLHKPDLGLDRASRAWIAEHCDRVVHCAASITFRAREGEPYRSNVDGTRFLLELCRESDIRDFHLVSTAYVCGAREGLVMEDDLECGQEFSNDYERSKFVSEFLVRQAAFLDRWTVYRPSVIVGDSTTGSASTNDGLYAFLSVAGLMAGETAERVFARLGMAAEERLNLVPVDWVSAAIRRLVDRPGDESTTYHLTHPSPVRAGALLEAARHLRAEAPRVPDRVLDELLAVYRPYMKHHCDFDVTHTARDTPGLPCPLIEGEVLERLVGFVAKRGFGVTRQADGRSELALNVVGDGGHALDLSSPAAATEIGSEEVRDARVSAQCTAETLDRLLSREITIEQAVYGGLLALEGEPSGMEHATHLLEAYLAEPRTTTLSTVGAPA